MTSNQVNYWRNKEEQRHNLTQESMDQPLKEAQTVKTIEETGNIKRERLIMALQGLNLLTQSIKNLSDTTTSIYGMGIKMGSMIG